MTIYEIVMILLGILTFNMSLLGFIVKLLLIIIDKVEKKIIAYWLFLFSLTL